MTNLQLGIAAALVAVASVLGLAAGYNELDLDDLSFGLVIFGIVAKMAVIACIVEHQYVAADMIIATVACGFLARLADYAIENTELYSDNVDLGRL